MIYAGILAGGSGKRMGHTELPKQFLSIAGKPLLIHTLEKFLLCNRFDRIYVGTVKEWLSHTKEIIENYIVATDRIRVCVGGADRNGTIMSIIDSIDAEFSISDDDIIVTHDAVRPFLSRRIIEDNIDAALQFGACDTIIPATDTIAVSENGEFLSEIPDRTKMYQGQTPQSFNIKLIRSCFDELSDDKKAILTDACKICVLSGVKVAVVMGDVNPGGEIVATGDIVVMGSCRGILHAGAEGDENCYIVAYNMSAQQLRIASHVATVPSDIGLSPLKVAVIQNSSIILTDYIPSQFKESVVAQEA